MNIKIKTEAKTKEENQEIASFLSKVLATVFDNRSDFSILKIDVAILYSMVPRKIFLIISSFIRMI
jgi:hypothetical protein